MWRLVGGPHDYIDSDILEWTGIRPNYIFDGALMFDCMRTWPESREGDLILLIFFASDYNISSLSYIPLCSQLVWIAV
jgi:hypothetical protein